MRRLVVLGGGHAHVEVLRRLGEEPVAGWEVVLVSPGPRQLYSGMLPGHVAGHYALDECAIDLAGLCARAGIGFHRNAASLVSPDAREVVLDDSRSLGFDLLSVDIGAKVFVGDVAGIDRHAIPVRPFETALAGWKRVVEDAAAGRVASLTIVGGGAAGVEMGLAMRHRLQAQLGPQAAHVRVISDKPRLVPEFPRGARRRFERQLRKRDIAIHAGAAVVEVERSLVRLRNGTRIVSDATFWMAGAAAPDLVRDSGFATDDKGYLLTDDCLRSVSHPWVFAAGDCATQRGRERPKAGVFAVRAGPALASNLRAAMTEAELKPHVTHKRYLALVSTGERHAVGIWDGIAWEGDWVWRWKDRIDRRFIARYAPPAGSPGSRSRT